MHGSVTLDTPAWEVKTRLGSYEAIAAGEPDTVGDTLLQFTGDQPSAFHNISESVPSSSTNCGRS
jgi:hypothetical protein